MNLNLKPNISEIPATFKPEDNSSGFFIGKKNPWRFNEINATDFSGYTNKYAIAQNLPPSR